ncbi:MAG: hypothetical protein AAFQ53_13805 [Bacteroidota bacterium]
MPLDVLTPVEDANGLNLLIIFREQSEEALDATHAHLMRVKDAALSERFGEEA